MSPIFILGYSESRSSIAASDDDRPFRFPLPSWSLILGADVGEVLVDCGGGEGEVVGLLV